MFQNQLIRPLLRLLGEKKSLKVAYDIDIRHKTCRVHIYDVKKKINSMNHHNTHIYSVTCKHKDYQSMKKQKYHLLASILVQDMFDTDQCMSKQNKLAILKNKQLHSNNKTVYIGIFALSKHILVRGYRHTGNHKGMLHYYRCKHFSELEFVQICLDYFIQNQTEK